MDLAIPILILAYLVFTAFVVWAYGQTIKRREHEPAPDQESQDWQFPPKWQPPKGDSEDD